MAQDFTDARASAEISLMALATQGAIDFASFTKLVRDLQLLKQTNRNSAYAATNKAVKEIKSNPEWKNHKDTLSYFVDDIDTLAEALINKDIPMSKEINSYKDKKLTLDDIKKLVFSRVRASNDKAIKESHDDKKILQNNAHTTVAHTILTDFFKTGRIDRNDFSRLTLSIKNMSNAEKEALAFKQKTPNNESEESLLNMALAIDTLDAMMAESFDPDTKDAATRMLRNNFAHGDMTAHDFHALIKQTYDRHMQEKKRAKETFSADFDTDFTENDVLSEEDMDTVDIDYELIMEAEEVVDTDGELDDAEVESSAETVMNDDITEVFEQNNPTEIPNHAIHWTPDFFIDTLKHFSDMINVDEDGMSAEDRIAPLREHYNDVLVEQERNPDTIRPGYAELLRVAPEAVFQYVIFTEGDRTTPLTDMLSDPSTMINVTGYIQGIRDDAAEKGRTLVMDSSPSPASAAFATNQADVSTQAAKLTPENGASPEDAPSEIKDDKKKHSSAYTTHAPTEHCIDKEHDNIRDVIPDSAMPATYGRTKPIDQIRQSIADDIARKEIQNKKEQKASETYKDNSRLADTPQDTKPDKNPKKPSENPETRRRRFW